MTLARPFSRAVMSRAGRAMGGSCLASSVRPGRAIRRTCRPRPGPWTGTVQTPCGSTARTLLAGLQGDVQTGAIGRVAMGVSSQLSGGRPRTGTPRRRSTHHPPCPEALRHAPGGVARYVERDWRRAMTLDLGATNWLAVIAATV